VLVTATPAGTPSITATSAGPCDSPAVSQRKPTGAVFHAPHALPVAGTITPMFTDFFRRHPVVNLIFFGLVAGCMLLSCLGAIGKSVSEVPGRAWGLLPGVVLGGVAVLLGARFARRPVRQRRRVYGGLFVFSLLIWLSQGIHVDGAHMDDGLGSTPQQLTALSYAAVVGGSLAIWLVTRRTRQLRTGVVDIRAEPVSVREHRAADRVRVLERWHYRPGRARAWWHRLALVRPMPVPYDPYLVARCACGWQGPPRSLHDEDAEELAFADARSHATLVDPEIVYPIDQETPA
jgi:hypothetical protein